MPLVLDLQRFKHQPVDIVDTDKMTAYLNGRQVLQANRPGSKDRNQEAVTELNLGLPRVVAAFNSGRFIHQIETQFKQIS